MSVSSELLCSFELLKPLDSSALKSHIKKGRNKRQNMLNSPVSVVPMVNRNGRRLTSDSPRVSSLRVYSQIPYLPRIVLCLMPTDDIVFHTAILGNRKPWHSNHGRDYGPMVGSNADPNLGTSDL